MAKGKYKYHYFYKITNLINNHFYYGIHSTNNIEDGYMGSGSRLHHAYKKYGMENFTKEILKYFDTREELAQYEADVVNEELVLDQNCYNISCGGEKWNTLNSISVKDKEGNYFRCKANDPKWLNGEYVGIKKDKVTVINTLTNKQQYITCEEYKNNKNIYISHFKDKVVVKHKNNLNEKWFIISQKEYELHKDLYVSLLGYYISVKDKNGKYYMVQRDDPRYLNGELTYFWAGRHHKEETKQKQHETYLKTNHQKGKTNSQYGTCWIHNEKESIKIKKEQLEEYISNGWQKGRIINFNKSEIIVSKTGSYGMKWVVNKDNQRLYIKTENLNEYLNQGYILGMKYKIQ